MIRDATPTKGGSAASIRLRPIRPHFPSFSFAYGGKREGLAASALYRFILPPFSSLSYKNGGKGKDRWPPPASGPFSPLYILEPNKGDSHLIQDDTPRIGYDRLGWLGRLATWSGIPPLICVEPDMRNGQWIRDAILILDRTG